MNWEEQADAYADWAKKGDYVALLVAYVETRRAEIKHLSGRKERNQFNNWVHALPNLDSRTREVDFRLDNHLATLAREEGYLGVGDDGVWFRTELPYEGRRELSPGSLGKYSKVLTEKGYPGVARRIQAYQERRKEQTRFRSREELRTGAIGLQPEGVFGIPHTDNALLHFSHAIDSRLVTGSYEGDGVYLPVQVNMLHGHMAYQREQRVVILPVVEALGRFKIDASTLGSEAARIALFHGLEFEIGGSKEYKKFVSEGFLLREAIIDAMNVPSWMT